MIANSKAKKVIKKWLYQYCPGFAGSFPYYGVKVYFPRKSYIFKLVLEQGVYEHDNVKLLISLVKPDTVYFDVGANIGLMSVPILYSNPTCKVVAFEPSPNNLPFLIRTAQNSRFRNRWHIVGKAVGEKVGIVKFSIASEENGVFDGFCDTKRVTDMREVSVSVTTIDSEWESMGRPHVSVIKIDVEGAELKSLQGALECIKKEKPLILTEWNSSNFAAYGCNSEDILIFSNQIQYQIYSIPYLLPINDVSTLNVQMLTRENFLLVPKEGRI
jgi:FkbM family methyltransferase